MKRKFSRAMVLFLSAAMLATQLIAPISAVGDGGESNENHVCVKGEFVRHIDPTCTDWGYDVRKCESCGEEFAPRDSYVNPLGHDMAKQNAKAPTCTEEGWNEHMACTRCDYTEGKEIKSAAGHKYIEIGRVESGCLTGNGHIDYKCSVCGHEKQEELKPAGHDYSAPKTVKEATCTNAKVVEYTCKKCGYKVTETVGEPLAHKPGDAVKVGKTVAATCEKAAYDVYVTKCKDCGTELKTENRDVAGSKPLGHKEVVCPEVKPTCLTPGLTGGSKCERCDKVFEEQKKVFDAPYDPLAESHKTPVITITKQDATCTEKGHTYQMECETCGEVLIHSEEIPALGHVEGEVKVVAPSCGADGHTDHYCSRCEKLYLTDNIIKAPAKAHEFVATGTVAPTCENDGYTFKECKWCHAQEDKEILPALGHKSVTDKAIAPTCTKDGLTEGAHCSVCNKVLIKQEVVKATGHPEDKVTILPAVKPTVDKTGLTEGRHCNVCDTTFVKQEVIGKTEQLAFTYEAKGVNGSKEAVNSGYITFNVYMNVKTDVARLWGSDIDIQYNKSLELIDVTFGENLFNQKMHTEFAVANKDVKDVPYRSVKISQDMGLNGAKEFKKGEYLFATLTFKVAKDLTGTTALTINLNSCDVAHDFDTLKNYIEVDFGAGAQIDVRRLGDANGNGKIDSTDAMLLSQWLATADLDDYNPIYDMDKNGVVDGDDLALIRGAVVRNDAYLDI